MTSDVAIPENINTFEDLSGTVTTAENPYDALIDACQGNSLLIQRRYQIHRESRNEQQKAKMLSLEFFGLILDPILQKLMDNEQYPGYADPRHCLVFWVRPPALIRDLVERIQQRLCKSGQQLWLMPLDCLHMTALEIAHSLTNSEIDRLVTTIQSKILEITDYTVNHRARLVQPLLSYDAQAVALSFLPGSTNSSEERSQDEADEFTYHHLRRDLYDLCRSTGVQVASRYVVPSAHLTIARYMNGKAASGNGDHKALDSTSMAAWIEHIEDINRWLKAEFWPGTSTNRELEWVVGDETGLDCRRGTVWYGGGSSVRVGQGSKSPK